MKHTFLKMICVVAIFATVVQAQQSAAPANKWEAEIKKFEEADRKNAPAKDVVLFTGSSSIRLWQSLAQDFPQVKVLNRGFGGSEIADSTFYVDRMIVPYQPRMILLYAGDNDIANNKNPQKVRRLQGICQSRPSEAAHHSNRVYLDQAESGTRIFA